MNRYNLFKASAAALILCSLHSREALSVAYVRDPVDDARDLVDSCLGLTKEECRGGWGSEGWIRLVCKDPRSNIVRCKWRDETNRCEPKCGDEHFDHDWILAEAQ